LHASYDVPEQDDLVVRAARLLQRETACTQGAEIEVVKRVPMGAGLGGGSSDAATVLLVLNRLWQCGLNHEDLAMLAARLGADVPVFIHGRTALAEGIGERLQPVQLGERHYVLVLPGISISTAEIFSAAELVRDSAHISLQEALAGKGRNDCEAVVRERYPDMARILDGLRQWGRPVMTGTGSGIFIEMKNEQQAKSTARALKSLYNVRAVRGVDRSPLNEKLDSDGI
jgi:4-diphosphocytidyl-2-C-methyl-D-erythritol kinase